MTVCVIGGSSVSQQIICHLLKMQHLVDVLDVNFGWDIQVDRCIVEDSPNTGTDQRICHRLRMFSGDGGHGNLNAVATHDFRQFVDRLDGIACDAFADTFRSSVEDVSNVETTLSKSSVAGDSTARSWSFR